MFGGEVPKHAKSRPMAAFEEARIAFASNPAGFALKYGLAPVGAAASILFYVHLQNRAIFKI